MRRVFIMVVSFLTCFFLISCDHVTPQDYISWVTNEENGLIKKRQIGTEYLIEAQLKPLEYMALATLSQDELNKEVLIKTCEEYEGMIYFTLKLGRYGSSDFFKSGSTNLKDYQEKLNYFTFSFQQDLSLEVNGKKIPCELFHFERSYDLAPHRTFTIGFPIKNIHQDLTLVLDSHQLGIGKCKLSFKKEHINNIPQLKLLS